MPNGLHWIHRAHSCSLTASSRVASIPVNRTPYSVSSVSQISLKGYYIWGCDGRKYTHFPGPSLFATAFISRISDVLLGFSPRLGPHPIVGAMKRPTLEFHRAFWDITGLRLVCLDFTFVVLGSTELSKNEWGCTRGDCYQLPKA